MFCSSSAALTVNPAGRSRALPARSAAVLVLLFAAWGMPVVQPSGPFAMAVAHADDSDSPGTSQVSGSGESAPDVPSTDQPAAPEPAAPAPAAPEPAAPAPEPAAAPQEPAAPAPVRHAAVGQQPVGQQPVGQAPTGQAHAVPAPAPVLVPQAVAGPAAAVTQTAAAESAHQAEPAKPEQPATVTLRVEQRPVQGANLAAQLVPDLPQETVGRLTLLLGAALVALLSLYVVAYRKACGLHID